MQAKFDDTGRGRTRTGVLGELILRHIPHKLESYIKRFLGVNALDLQTKSKALVGLQREQRSTTRFSRPPRRLNRLRASSSDQRAEAAQIPVKSSRDTQVRRCYDRLSTSFLSLCYPTTEFHRS